MTRDEIKAELAERAALPAPIVPDGMTEEEEIAWLHDLIEARRREMGTENFRRMAKRNAESLAASPSYRA